MVSGRLEAAQPNEHSTGEWRDEPYIRSRMRNHLLDRAERYITEGCGFGRSIMRETWPLGAPSPWAHWLDARALGLIDPWAQGPMGSCGEGLGIIVFRTNLLPWHHDVLTCPTKREGGQKIKQTKSGCYKEDPGQADRQSQVSKVLPTPFSCAAHPVAYKSDCSHNNTQDNGNNGN